MVKATDRCLINTLEDALLEQIFGDLPFEDRCTNSAHPTPSVSPSSREFAPTAGASCGTLRVSTPAQSALHGTVITHQ